MSTAAPAQVIQRSRTEVVHAVALALLLIGEQVAIGRIGFEIEQGGIGLRGTCKCRVARRILYFFLSNENRAPIADTFEIFLSVTQHAKYNPRKRDKARVCSGTSRIAIRLEGPLDRFSSSRGLSIQRLSVPRSQQYYPGVRTGSAARRRPSWVDRFRREICPVRLERIGLGA